MTVGNRRQVSRWVAGTGVAGTVFIACGAFWLSFTALTHLAVASGIDERQAWAWPLIVDGIIVVATVSVVALAGREGVWYPWALLIGGAAVSVTANAIQASLASGVTVPRGMAAAVAAVPPVVLLAITHLTVVLTRRTPAVGPAPTRDGPPLGTPPVWRPIAGAPPAPASPHAPGPGQREASSRRQTAPAANPVAESGRSRLAGRAETPSPEPGVRASRTGGPGTDPGQGGGAASPLSIYALAGGPSRRGAGDDGGGLGEGSRTWLVERARRMRAEGMSYRAVGKALGRNGTTIARWLNDNQDTTGQPGGHDAE
ncbi:MAG: DUF2637 domain-containing protein [Bifidobacteriaceae bacterium]|nr:DUF2637 domain-containing protein [Bifidobacteriaceae bacterium]